MVALVEDNDPDGVGGKRNNKGEALFNQLGNDAGVHFLVVHDGSDIPVDVDWAPAARYIGARENFADQFLEQSSTRRKNTSRRCWAMRTTIQRRRPRTEIDRPVGHAQDTQCGEDVNQGLSHPEDCVGRMALVPRGMPQRARRDQIDGNDSPSRPRGADPARRISPEPVSSTHASKRRRVGARRTRPRARPIRSPVGKPGAEWKARRNASPRPVEVDGKLSSPPKWNP